MSSFYSKYSFLNLIKEEIKKAIYAYIHLRYDSYFSLVTTLIGLHVGLVLLQHSLIFFTHPGIQTLLDIHVDVHSSVVRNEVGKLIEDSRTSEENHHIFHSSQGSGGSTESVEENGSSGDLILFYNNLALKLS